MAHILALPRLKAGMQVARFGRLQVLEVRLVRVLRFLAEQRAQQARQLLQPRHRGVWLADEVQTVDTASDTDRQGEVPSTVHRRSHRSHCGRRGVRTSGGQLLQMEGFGTPFSRRVWVTGAAPMIGTGRWC